MLEAAGPQHSTPQLKHIRAYHHVIAMRLAAGDRPGAIAATMGFSPGTISVLQNSPQFAELVETYRERVVSKAVDTVEIMSLVANESLMALHERLVDDELRSEMTPEFLRRVAETFTDRTGHSPVRRSESNNVHRVQLDSSRIEQIKSRFAESRRWNEPVDCVPLASGHQADSESVGAAASSALIFLPAQKAIPSDEPSGEGEGV